MKGIVIRLYSVMPPVKQDSWSVPGLRVKPLDLRWTYNGRLLDNGIII